MFDNFIFKLKLLISLTNYFILTDWQNFIVCTSSLKLIFFYKYIVLYMWFNSSKLNTEKQKKLKNKLLSLFKFVLISISNNQLYSIYWFQFSCHKSSVYELSAYMLCSIFWYVVETIWSTLFKLLFESMCFPHDYSFSLLYNFKAKFIKLENQILFAFDFCYVYAVLALRIK
jgi:hypothetical protein